MIAFTGSPKLHWIKAIAVDASDHIYTGCTYPNDPRVDQNSDVGSRALGAGAWRIGGKLFVGRSSQEGYRLELYRQETATDGEVLDYSLQIWGLGRPRGI